MHQLYLHYLSCKGAWEKCTLVISIRKQFENQFRETYEFWDFSTMKEKLGEELATDLVERHKKQEEKLPANKKGMFIRKILAIDPNISSNVQKSCIFKVCLISFALACVQGIPTFPTTRLCGGTRTLPVWLRKKLRSSNTKRSCRDKPPLTRNSSCPEWNSSDWILDIDIFTSSLVSKMRMLVGNTCEKLAWIFDQSGEWTSWLATPRDNALDEAEDGSSAAKPALTPGAPTPRPQKSQKPVKEKTIEQLASQARFHSIPEFSYMMMILHTHIYI